MSAHIVFISTQLRIHSSQSLKQKRRVLKSYIEKLRSKFNISIAEIDAHDKWQLAVVGISIISADKKYLESCIHKIEAFSALQSECELFDFTVQWL